MTEDFLKPNKKNKLKKIFKRLFALILVSYFIFPEYWKAAIYPYLYGKQKGIEQTISEQDYFEDVDMEPFYFERNGSSYFLTPKTIYRGTGRVGIVDHYDTWWNKYYRGYSSNPSQKLYIDLVPQDLVLVIGKMAEPDIFVMFEFKHEERAGGPRCKGVKYRTSFMSLPMSEKAWKKNQENYDKCNPYINDKEYNNYHPIPANKNVNAALSMLKHGDIVTLEGFLVNVTIDGQTFLQSATRHAQSHPWAIISGMVPGWCFLLYTQKIIVNGVLYE